MGFRKVYKLFEQVLDIWEEETFLLQLKYKFLDEISILLLCMQATELSTQMIRVLSSDGDCVRFRYCTQRMILTITSRAGLISLHALLHNKIYCHRLQSLVSQSKGCYSWTDIHASVVGIQHMLDGIQVPEVLILVVSQITKMLLWVGYLR